MKFLTIFYALFILHGINEAVSYSTNQNDHKKEPICIKSFKKLHSPRRISKEQLLLSTSSKALNASNMHTKWITQKLDHFDKNNTETWQMRYMVDESVYKPGSPIFIYIGGEWTILAEDPYYYQIVDFVQEYNGLLAYTEYRFYGESHPKPDLRVEYLEKYFNAEQALADLAHLIRTMKKTVKGASKSKIILVGGSYAGSLVTWFTKLYPDLTDGGWASSAILNILTDFVGYKETMGQSIIAKSGQTCYNRVKNAFEQAQNMFKDSRATELKTMMNLCSNFNETYYLDLWNLFYLYSDNFATSIQYAGSNTIQEVCENFVNDNEDYVNFAKYFISRFKDKPQNVNKTCIDVSYQTLLNSLTPIEYDQNPNGDRQWFYQCCNEIGWFQTSDSTAQPFGSEYPLEYFETICIDVFGKKYTSEYTTKRGEELNKKFGALNPNVTNVHFTQGSLDPWRSVGIQTYVIEGASHTQDLYKPASTDSPQMAAAHKKIAELVRDWISDK